MFVGYNVFYVIDVDKSYVMIFFVIYFSLKNVVVFVIGGVLGIGVDILFVFVV